MLLTFGYPYIATITTTNTIGAVTSTAEDQVITLAPGATVTFHNGVTGTDPIAIAYTFDDPSGATAASPASTTGGASGNVTILNAGQSSRRRFSTAGTFKWTATASGAATWNNQTISGSIVSK